MAYEPSRSVGALAVPDRLLLTPGPSNIHPRVAGALASPVIGHLDALYFEIMDDVQELLRYAFQTSNRHTFVLPATGMGGMEAVFTNLVEAGDRVLVCVNGFFGNRMCEVVERLGGELVRLEAEWGSAVDPAALRRKLAQERNLKAVAIVHPEASTGVLHPLAEIGAMCREHEALFIADCVVSLGGCLLEVDAWGIDAAYAGSQKCLSAPPGLAPVTFSPRAVAAIGKRRGRVPSFYFDLLEQFRYWSEERVYHHTAPINTVYALREALRLLHEEGLEARIARHAQNSTLLVEQLERLGLVPFAHPDVRLPPLTTVRIPTGVEDRAVRQRLLSEFNIEISGGIGAIAGKVWRIGLMGYNSHPRNVYALSHALRAILGRG